VPALAGRDALIVDGEDTFTGMLAHQLRALGIAVRVAAWDSAFDAGAADLLVVGPGPGDPASFDDPKMASLRAQLLARLGAGAPLLAICLGHQLLAGLLGLRLHRRDAPYQGIQRVVDLFGTPRRVGFYSTFTARAAGDALDTPYGRVDLARDPADGAVHALRGPGFAGVQFHPESVLSQDGLTVLSDLVPNLCDASVDTA
jgi:phenazine biosynthesis protein phzE